MSTAAALEDIEDVQGYVTRIVQRRFPGLDQREWDDAIAEGVALTWKLHCDWTPARCTSFAKYISTYLYLRLVDWVRVEMRQRGNQHMRQRGDGGFETVYCPAVQSLDYIAELKLARTEHRGQPYRFGQGASPVDMLIEEGIVRDQYGRQLVGWLDR